MQEDTNPSADETANREFPPACALVKPQLTEYAAGTLPPLLAQQVATHLASCEACTQDAAFDRLFQLALPRLPIPAPPPALFEQIALATYAAPARRTMREIVLGYLAPPTTRLALGTAFAVGIAALVVPRLIVPTDPSAPAPVANVPAPAVRKESAPAVVHTPPSSAVARNNAKQAGSGAKPVVPVRATAPVVAALPVPTEAPTSVLPPSSSGMDATRRALPAPVSVVRVSKSSVATTSGMKPKTPVGGATLAPVHTTPEIAPATHEKQTIIATAHPVIKEPLPETHNVVLPDMDKATQVAVATMPERHQPAPATESVPLADTTPALRSITFKGMNAGNNGAKVILQSRQASDVNTGSGTNLPLVVAPAKIN